MVRWAFALILVAGCSGNTGTLSSASGQQASVATQDGGSCQYPTGVVVNASPTSPGCYGHPPAQDCQVSNGATVNAQDGAVTSGTETCSSLCPPSYFEMTCENTNAGPDPALGCAVIPIPTPSCCGYYCCPCAP